MNGIIETAGYLFGITLLRYIVIAGVVFVFAYHIFKKKLERSKIQQKVIKKKDVVREIFHSLQSTVVFTIITCIILLTPMKDCTLIYDEISDYPYWWIGASTLLSLVVHDTYFYWMHRLLHHKRIFRYTHVVHHKSTNPSPWASYSFHILEAIPEGLILVVLVFVLPMHLLSISIFTVLGLIINVYGHLGYEIAPRSFRNTVFFSIINTSVHHNLHHSRFIGNYGLYFRFWDKLMKTEVADYEEKYDNIQQKRFSKLS